jgi:hypothetical protein
METCIIDEIKDKKMSTVILKYYPYIDDYKNMIDIKDKPENKNLSQYVKQCRNIKVIRYNEVSVYDKYVTINTTCDNIYYRKQLYIYIPDSKPGIYILELRDNCFPECIPHIIDYHSNVEYKKNIYEFDDVNICYNTVNNKTYLEINKTIDITNTEKNVSDFIKNIDSFIKRKII